MRLGSWMTAHAAGGIPEMDAHFGERRLTTPPPRDEWWHSECALLSYNEPSVTPSICLKFVEHVLRDCFVALFTLLWLLLLCFVGLGPGKRFHMLQFLWFGGAE